MNAPTGIHDPVEHLNAHQCWALLQDAPVGRLAVAAIHGVDIFPVNHRVHERRLLFRTTAGTKLVSLLVDNAVAFEVDGWDDREAWSVVVKGTARPLREQAELRHMRPRDPHPWTPDPKNVVVEITPSDITGRRFARAQPHEPMWYW